MGFWSVYMGIEGGGEAAAVPDPNEGWIARSRARVWFCAVRDRVWIARGKG